MFIAKISGKLSKFGLLNISKIKKYFRIIKLFKIKKNQKLIKIQSTYSLEINNINQKFIKFKVICINKIMESKRRNESKIIKIKVNDVELFL